MNLTAVRVLSGKFHAGTDCVIGDDVTIDVAEEVVVGDRVTLAPGTFLSGRRVVLGDDFFGYDWSHAGRALDVGRGRRDDEDAVLTVGSRCTFHDNRIDLARSVTIGDDVGLSPEVVIYTHGYWGSALNGFPCRYEEVSVGDGTLVGFRSTLLAGCRIGRRCVVGAGSVCTGQMTRSDTVWAGNPAKSLKYLEVPDLPVRVKLLDRVMQDYEATVKWRRLPVKVLWDYPFVQLAGFEVNVETREYAGPESEFTDDLRWWLFSRGIRCYTKRGFKKLEKR